MASSFDAVVIGAGGLVRLARDPDVSGRAVAAGIAVGALLSGGLFGALRARLARGR